MVHCFPKQLFRCYHYLITFLLYFSPLVYSKLISVFFYNYLLFLLYPSSLKLTGRTCARQCCGYKCIVIGSGSWNLPQLRFGFGPNLGSEPSFTRIHCHFWRKKIKNIFLQNLQKQCRYQVAHEKSSEFTRFGQSI